MIDPLSGRITALDRAIAALSAADRDLAARARSLAAVPGIGAIVPATLLRERPQHDTLRRRRIASLPGLAPQPRESGPWRGARRIRGGRRKVPAALAIAALPAFRRIPAPLGMPDRMRAAGKAPETIPIAVVRQRLVILDAMLRSGTPVAA